MLNTNLIRQAIALLQEALSEPAEVDSLRWGAKVSKTFKERVIWIGKDLGFDPNWLMDCMAFESAETFRPDIRNAAGSGATGLIQFMPRTARGLDTTTDALAAMTAEDQLNFVWKYFSPYKNKIKNLDDMYMAILWPRAVGKPNDYVLFSGASSIAYRQNAGLDINKDNKITKAEACAKVREKTKRGEQFRG
jgi:hypothetical protein